MGLKQTAERKSKRERASVQQLSAAPIPPQKYCLVQFSSLPIQPTHLSCQGAVASCQEVACPLGSLGQVACPSVGPSGASSQEEVPSFLQRKSRCFNTSSSTEGCPTSACHKEPQSNPAFSTPSSDSITSSWILPTPGDGWGADRVTLTWGRSASAHRGRRASTAWGILCRSSSDAGCGCRRCCRHCPSALWGHHLGGKEKGGQRSAAK